MKTTAKIILFLEIAFFVFVSLQRTSLFKKKPLLNFSGEKEISINDTGLIYKVKTSAKNVAETLTQDNIPFTDSDQVYPDKNTEIFPQMTVLINRPSSVEISVDGNDLKKTSFAKTVSDILAENNIAMSRLDVVEPHLETRLSSNLKITVTRINTEEVIEEEDIDFKVVKERDGKIDWGVKSVSQKGEIGKRESVYKITYKNGKQIEKIKLSSKITEEPTTEIQKIGTRIRVGKSNSGIASWYGTDATSCSSRDFPAGTWLRVINRANGKQAFARVEGFGPQAGTGKLIDLSKEIFQKLAPLGQGTTKVTVEEILNKGFDPNQGD